MTGDGSRVRVTVTAGAGAGAGTDASPVGYATAPEEGTGAMTVGLWVTVAMAVELAGQYVVVRVTVTWVW